MRIFFQLNLKITSCLILLAGSMVWSTALYGQQKTPDYKNPNLPISVRINDLISRMTLREKVRQMDMYSGHNAGQNQLSPNKHRTIKQFEHIIGTRGIGAIHDLYPASAKEANKIQRYAITHTRLGIPVLFFEEGLHDYGGAGSTVFPQSIGLSSTWDTSLVRKVGHAIGAEARAHGMDMLFCPVLGLARDPRWGRVEETYGEDPYLDGAMGVAMVKGLQGKTLTSNSSVIAEPKHF
ncbi:MAG TPA: glycoside hydrolase family 3 N-terminal domain-containing protein, partial [Balneolaceae bacterium]|nr:glycoside hydrolase family 3 N-terminal domain-containing protein [Balneolaceae bacterium]